ncbi:mucin-19-like isoform X2 [Dermacentor albipictus]|uniref:mucin-19-like isoform X2 n=1 Tax=Dermacentor albipictus TaxID=60249 RepID=UPI0031FDD880
MSAPKQSAGKDNNAPVLTTPTPRCTSNAHGTSRNRRSATSAAKKEAVSERTVSRQVKKPAMSASADSKPVILDTDQLDALLKDLPASDAAVAESASSNGKPAEDQGDSAVKGAVRGKTVSASTGPVKVVTTENHRIVTDEIGFDAPREDTTTTSFEAHVRMRMSRPRVPEGKAFGKAAREDQPVHGRGAAASQDNRRSPPRHSASGRTSPRSACPDFGGGVADVQTGARTTCGCDHGACCCCCGCCCARSSSYRETAACCSASGSSTCSSCSQEDAYRTDASSPRDQWFSAGSASSTSACSNCREPEIGALLRTTASFCETLAQALSVEQHGTRQH